VGRVGCVAGVLRVRTAREGESKSVKRSEYVLKWQSVRGHARGERESVCVHTRRPTVRPAAMEGIDPVRT
jgi:hypothetical protein